MPYNVTVRTNKWTRVFTYYTRAEADRLGIEYAVPPMNEETFDRFDFVLTENNYVIPVIEWRWDVRKGMRSREPKEYVTPYGTTTPDRYIFCPCTPRGFLNHSRDEVSLRARQYTIMAKWMTMYGDASIAYRMTYGRQPEQSELELILADEQFQVILRNEMANSSDDLIIPLREIIRIRLRLTAYLEDVVKKWHDILVGQAGTDADLKNFIKLFETQQKNLTDLETGYVRNIPDQDSRELEFNWKVRARNTMLPKSKPAEIEPFTPSTELLPEGYEFLEPSKKEELNA